MSGRLDKIASGRLAPRASVPTDDAHTVRINIEGKDPMALRFIAGDERIGQVIDVHYGEYVHTLRLSPTGKRAAIWGTKRR